jgi:hypothetical protein
MIDLSYLDKRRGICLLSSGMGQQSTAMLALLTDEKRRDVYDTYVGDRNLVVCHADTQNEGAETVAFRAWTANYCNERRITYATITADMGYHVGGWAGGLTGQWDKNSTVGSVTFPSTCSDQLKVSPLYAALGDLLRKLYGFSGTRKREFYEYQEHFKEKLPVLIGFGKGEEGRAGLPTAANDGQMNLIDLLGLAPEPVDHKNSRLWMARNIHKRYPLIDLGFDRHDCQDYLRERGLPVPPPSMCEFCMWTSHAQIEAMRRFQPEKLDTWIAYEQRKIEAWRERTALSGAQNAFVKGSIPLTVFAAQAQAQYAGFSDEALREHIFSHGHQVRSQH